MGTLPNERVKRTSHRNGVVATEETYRGRVLHGPVRRWYRNGRLASEESYANGLLHGVCRQWREDGKLLGSFRMENGTGVQRAWFDDGSLQLEQFFVAGNLNGPSRLWLPDGTLLSEIWMLENHQVTRGEYSKAAAFHPEWPVCKRRIGHDPRMSPSRVQVRGFELHCDWLLGRKNNREATKWLATGDGTNRALGRLSHKQAARLVTQLADSGAQKVLAVDIYESKAGKQFSDALLVRLPKSRPSRLAVRGLFHSLPSRVHCAVQPECDGGEPWLYVYFG